MTNKLLIIVLTICLCACKQKNTNQASFYFWRTVFSMSPSEKQCLINNKVKAIYVRFFDVDIDTQTNERIPIGVIDSLAQNAKNIEIIPVVFITNRTFLNSSNNNVKKFATQLIHKINTVNNTYSELQIDCDWSQKSREHYFSFLSELKKQLNKDVKLTCTIRLHQIKYPVASGIPPVNGGMLMYYNMGNIHDLKEKNSIYNEELAKKYVAYVSNYTLHLDVALPIFNWVIHYRNNEVVGLITKKQLPNLKNDDYFYEEEKNVKYIVKLAQFLNGVYYKKGDVLKKESLTEDELLEAAKLLNQYLPDESRRIVLYDLDDVNIKNYEKETIKTVFSTFNK